MIKIFNCEPTHKAKQNENFKHIYPSKIRSAWKTVITNLIKNEGENHSTVLLHIVAWE